MSRILLLGLFLVTTAGCQCCWITERYQDVVDHIADHEHPMDRFYIPALDLTRIRCHRCTPGMFAPGCRICETGKTIPTIAEASGKTQLEELEKESTVSEQVLETSVADTSEPESEVQRVLYESTPPVRQEKPLSKAEVKRKPIEAPEPVTAPKSVKPKPIPPVFSSLTDH